MSVLIRADASASTGTGHLMRMLALAQGLLECGEPVVVAAAELPSHLAERLRHEGIALLRIDATIGSVEDAAATVSAAERAGSAWVVTDGYRFEYPFQRVVAGSRRLMVVDDYVHSPAYCCDAILNSNVYASRDMYLDSLDLERADRTELLLGTPHLLLRREFRERVPRRRVRRDVRRVLVTLGGADTAGATSIIARALALPELRRLDRTVVIGRDTPCVDTLAGAVRETGADVLTGVDDMANLMHGADLAVCAGGSTVFELLYLGVPSIVVTVAKNQERSVRELAASGAVVPAGPVGRLDALSVRDVVSMLSDDHALRSRCARVGRQLVDGRGVQRVARFLVGRR